MYSCTKGSLVCMGFLVHMGAKCCHVIAVMVLGVELYGMNRKLMDTMRVLLNCTLQASIGARRAGQVTSVGLWKKK